MRILLTMLLLASACGQEQLISAPDQDGPLLTEARKVYEESDKKWFAAHEKLLRKTVLKAAVEGRPHIVRRVTNPEDHAGLEAACRSLGLRCHRLTERGSYIGHKISGWAD